VIGKKGDLKRVTFFSRYDKSLQTGPENRSSKKAGVTPLSYYYETFVLMREAGERVR